MVSIAAGDNPTKIIHGMGQMDIEVHMGRKETQDSIQKPKEKGDLALPNLKEYFYAAQMRNDEFVARWKNIKLGTIDMEVRNLIAHKGLLKKLDSQLDIITKIKVEIWNKGAER